MKVVILLALIALASAKRRSIASYEQLISRIGSSRPVGADPAFDCAWRVFALEYGQKIQPYMTPAQYQALTDAVSLCPGDVAPPFATSLQTEPGVPKAQLRSDVLIYVDAEDGSDANNGTITSPLQTLPAALAASRQARIKGASAPGIVLRDTGTFYLNETLVLTAADSQLSFTAYAGEQPVVSGGIPYHGLVWSAHNLTNSSWGPVLQDENAVYGLCGDPGVPNKGAMPDWQSCQASCQGDDTCTGMIAT
jgi:hypothetical protein